MIVTARPASDVGTFRATLAAAERATDVGTAPVDDALLELVVAAGRLLAEHERALATLGRVGSEVGRLEESAARRRSSSSRLADEEPFWPAGPLGSPGPQVNLRWLRGVHHETWAAALDSAARKVRRAMSSDLRTPPHQSVPTEGES